MGFVGKAEEDEMKRALIKTSNIDKFKKWSLLIVAIIIAVPLSGCQLNYVSETISSSLVFPYK